MPLPNRVEYLRARVRHEVPKYRENNSEHVRLLSEIVPTCLNLSKSDINKIFVQNESAAKGSGNAEYDSSAISLIGGEFTLNFSSHPIKLIHVEMYNYYVLSDSLAGPGRSGVRLIPVPIAEAPKSITFDSNDRPGVNGVVRIVNINRSADSKYVSEEGFCFLRGSSKLHIFKVDPSQ